MTFCLRVRQITCDPGKNYRRPIRTGWSTVASEMACHVAQRYRDTGCIEQTAHRLWWLTAWQPCTCQTEFGLVGHGAAANYHPEFRSNCCPKIDRSGLAPNSLFGLEDTALPPKPGREMLLRWERREYHAVHSARLCSKRSDAPSSDPAAGHRNVGSAGLDVRRREFVTCGVERRLLALKAHDVRT